MNHLEQSAGHPPDRLGNLPRQGTPTQTPGHGRDPEHIDLMDGRLITITPDGAAHSENPFRVTSVNKAPFAAKATRSNAKRCGIRVSSESTHLPCGSSFWLL